MVLLAVEAVAEPRAVDLGGHGDGCARGVVLLRSPMCGLVVDPVPRADDARVGGDAQVPLGGGPVGDRCVEACDDDGADAVRAAVLDRGAGGGVEIDRGLVVRRQGGEARGLAGRHAAGSAGADRHGVGASVAELAGRIPPLLAPCQDAGDRLAGFVDHRDVADGAGEGGDPDGAGGVDVLGARRRDDGQRRRFDRRRPRSRLRDWPGGKRLAALRAIRRGGDDDTAEHGQHREYSRQTGTTDTASRRQLISSVVRRRPQRSGCDRVSQS